MAARYVLVTRTPTAIAGLVDSTWYQIQNQAPDERVYVATVAGRQPQHAPAVGDAAFMLTPGMPWQVRQEPGGSVWVWATGPVRLCLDEAE